MASVKVMTDITDVFMISIDSKIDPDTLKRIYESRQNNIPIYEETTLDSIALVNRSSAASRDSLDSKSCRVKRFVGILPARSYIFIDPKGRPSSRQTFPIPELMGLMQMQRPFVTSH